MDRHVRASRRGPRVAIGIWPSPQRRPWLQGPLQGFEMINEWGAVAIVNAKGRGRARLHR